MRSTSSRLSGHVLLSALLAIMVSACSTHFVDPDPRFARLESELEGMRYSGGSAPVNSQDWVEEVNDSLQYGHTLFYSHAEQRWVLASHDIQFDLFSFSQLDVNDVHTRLSVPGREGSDSGGNTGANVVRAKVLDDAAPIQRLFRSGETDDENILRLPAREASDAIKVAKMMRYLIAENPKPR
ncbi:hypothetical protein [Allohahella marinimesophila]